MQHLHNTSTTRKLQHQICPIQIILLYELCFLKIYSIAENKLIQVSWRRVTGLQVTPWDEQCEGEHQLAPRLIHLHHLLFGLVSRCSPCNHHFLGQGSWLRTKLPLHVMLDRHTANQRSSRSQHWCGWCTGQQGTRVVFPHNPSTSAGSTSAWLLLFDWSSLKPLPHKTHGCDWLGCL